LVRIGWACDLIESAHDLLCKKLKSLVGGVVNQTEED
jgi:hypothetical protein